MNNRPIHFEVQADDAERAKKFYESVLGWDIERATMPGVGMDWFSRATDTEGNTFGLLQATDWQPK
ncbi:MAG TPA: VOC family protein [Candidatus Paceibacterota bacterium]|nr:VOC family protein [Candidatus Paceibacterota bacterium]